MGIQANLFKPEVRVLVRERERERERKRDRERESYTYSLLGHLWVMTYGLVNRQFMRASMKSLLLLVVVTTPYNMNSKLFLLLSYPPSAFERKSVRFLVVEQGKKGCMST